ncbi:MAG: polyphosphate polymerase domain-containing protein, partial [Firmicutes bacterium]|nr:polyphosphate polymerase domain-containing protein [Bacillota bacterium]
MDNKLRYRHELKFEITYFDYLNMRNRLKAVMQSDPHTVNGKYLIRSIYFDNYRDKALLEKINGYARREKFRIRYYNDDFSFISLEKKMKINDLCLKASAPISEEECRKLLDGDREWMLENASELVKEFYTKLNTQLLRPQVLVSYTREPYIFKAGNVRVTFDMDIRSTLFKKEFLQKEVSDINVGEKTGDMILEVKFDDYLPDVIADIIQLGSCEHIAFSKYGACRR